VIPIVFPRSTPVLNMPRTWKAPPDHIGVCRLCLLLTIRQVTTLTSSPPQVECHGKVNCSPQRGMPLTFPRGLSKPVGASLAQVTGSVMPLNSGANFFPLSFLDPALRLRLERGLPNKCPCGVDATLAGDVMLLCKLFRSGIPGLLQVPPCVGFLRF